MKYVIQIFLCFFIIATGNAYADILFQDNFDGYSDSPSNHGWGAGSAITTPTNEGYNNTRCAKISYKSAGTGAYWFGWNGISSYNRSEIYVRFYFRLAAGQGGEKFCKIFGKQDGTGYANTTTPLEQDSGHIKGIRYGNGSGIENDTQAYIFFNARVTDPNVNTPTTSSNIIPDNQWHCYEFYMKYNTDNNRDGEYKIWLDGILRLHATNVKNRNNANTRAFASIHFANYTATTTAYERPIWYDNFVIADQYIGPIGGSTSEPPGRPGIFEEVPQ